jgi:hypothetical protein
MSGRRRRCLGTDEVENVRVTPIVFEITFRLLDSKSANHTCCTVLHDDPLEAP